MSIREQIEAVVRIRGGASVFPNIDATIRDFKSAGYTRGEIKETLREFYYGIDGAIDAYLVRKGF